jgi:hypothetical protein
MENQKSDIRVLLSDQAEAILDDILKSLNLEEKNAITDGLIKNYAKEILSENDFIIALQKDLNISEETAQRLGNEIRIKIMPILEKIPEEKFKEPGFSEEISRKIFNEKINSGNGPLILTKEKTPTGITNISMDLPQKNNADTNNFKKNVSRPKDMTPTPPKPAPKRNKPKSNDSYREPIE